MQFDVFFTFVGSLTTLAVCIAAGYISRKTGIMTDSVNAGMSALLVKVALPCMVFVSMMRPFSPTLLAESVATIFISGAVYLSGYFIGMGIARLMGAKEDQKRVWQFSLVFGNVAYMGFPVVQAVYGYEGLFYSAMANISFNVLAFSLGVYLFRRDGNIDFKTNIKSIALNPALIGTYLGFIFFVTGWRLPPDIQDGIGLVGGMTVPTSMLLVGSILAKNRLLSLIGDIRVAPVIFMRLVGIPVLAFLLLSPFVHNTVMLGVIVVLAAMPAAALTVIFAEQYKGDTAEASKIVALSSLLCLITIPLISLILQ